MYGVCKGGSCDCDDDDDDNDDEDDGYDADHHLLVLPPHLILHLPRSVPQVVTLIGQRLTLLHQNFDLLAALDDLIHIAQRLLLQVAELLPETGELVDFGLVVVLPHPVLQDGLEVLEGVPHCLAALGGVVSGEEGLLYLLEEVGSDACLVLREGGSTADSTMTRKTKPSLTKV
jgi:hypothetical protein